MLNVSLSFVYLAYMIVFIVALLIFFGIKIPHLEEASKNFVELVFPSQVLEDKRKIMEYKELVFLGAIGLLLVHLIGIIGLLKSFFGNKSRFVREDMPIFATVPPLGFFILTGFLFLGKDLPIYVVASALWILVIPIYFGYERLKKYSGSPVQQAVRFFLAGTALGIMYWGFLVLLRAVL